MEGIRAALIDIDGVLTVSWKALPGTVGAMEQLRDAGLPVALVTNNTSRTRSVIASRLAGLGFPVGAGDILTAPAATAAYLREHFPGARCLLLNSGDVRDDLTGVTLVDEGDADVVVLGGAGDEFDCQALNRVFRQLQGGASPSGVRARDHGRAGGGSNGGHGPPPARGL